MASDRRCDVCGSPNPGAHYGAFPCPGDATLRPLVEKPMLLSTDDAYEWRQPADPYDLQRSLVAKLDRDEAMRRGKR